MHRLSHHLRGRASQADLLLWLALALPLPLTDDAPAWLRALAAPLLAAAVAVSRRAPLAALAVPALLSLAATPELFTYAFTPALVAFAHLLGRRSPDVRTALPFFTTLVALGLVLSLSLPGASPADWFALVATVLFALVLPWLLGRYRRQHSELVRTGWELAARMEREHRLVADRTRLRERTRIAGDMHDSLGHDLSLIAVRAAALQVAPTLDETARESAAELRQAAADATERLREIIGVLRETGEEGETEEEGEGDPVPVEELVEHAAASGLQVSLIRRTSPGLLPRPLHPITGRALHRVVQESLTNAAKHAPGTPVTVTVTRGPDTVETTVSNPLPERQPPGPGTGSGLASLESRVHHAGGTLHAHPVDNAYEVTARLPLEPPPSGATPPTSRQELALARRRVRRRILDAIWIPTAALAVLALLMFGFNLYTSYRSVLETHTYDRLHIGDTAPATRPHLPAYEFDDETRPRNAPADPPDTDECRFYRTSALHNSPLYRLCFTDGALSHKDRVTTPRSPR